MKKQILNSTFAIVTFISFAAIDALAAGPFEKMSRMKEKPGEFYGYVRTITGDSEIGTVTFSQEGVGGGIGAAFHFNDYLSVNTELGGGSMDTTVIDTTGTIGSVDLSFFEWKVGMDYNILKTRLTPFLSPAIGLQSQSADVAGVSIQESVLTYGIGAGLRWDISERFLAKASYRMDWASFEDTTTSTRFDGFVIALGYKF
jgi:opacity protein-like surface antigen